ncbi:MAG: LuxR C-terminal-related transcriptional regulator [Pseudomonadota bacterium]
MVYRPNSRMMQAPAGELNPPIGGERAAEQAAPLLGVKIRQPWRSRGVIARARLDGYLDIIRNRLLTLLVAPPGYGKTTAAVAWVDALAGTGAHVAWLSLGPEDDEPERFLDYLDAAIAQALGKSTQLAGGALSATFSVPMETRLGWLLEELGSLPQEVYLFLDDFHLVSHAQILGAMDFLLRYAPENFHVLLLSRETLALNLGALRARDSVFEIPASTLLFDVGETDQLLQKGEFVHALSDQAPALHTLTGGWIAALRAAVATLRSHGKPEQYLGKLPATLRPISSLFSDLMERLAPELVDFLERICITERHSAALVEALGASPNGQAMLERIEQLQLFISRQDDRGSWFVLHPLFREYLEQRAGSRAGLDMTDLHQRAAHWFAAQSLWSEAIHHALAANDVGRALAWIESSAMVLVGDGDILTLLSWERQLRAHLVARPIRLRLAFAWALCLAMASERALALVDGVEAELAAPGQPAQHDTLLSECTALRAVLLSEKGDYDAASVLANQYLRAPVAQPWVPNAILNVIASAHLQAGRWEQLQVVPPFAQDSHEQRVRDRTSMVYRLSILGLAEYRQGHLENAARYLEEGMALGAAIGTRGHVLHALPAPTLALVRYEQNRLADAQRINAEHFEVNRRVGPIDGLSGCYRIAARTAHMQGQLVLARTLLDDAERIAMARGWNTVQAAVCMERVRYALLDGRMTDARASMERLDILATSVDNTSTAYADLHQSLALAGAWRDLVDGAHAAAAASLEPLLQTVRSNGRLLDHFSIATALCMAWLALGRRDESLELFIGVCRQAQAAGAVRSILDQPLPTDELVRLATDHARSQAQTVVLVEFLQRLQDAGAASPGASTAAPQTAATGPSLSPREHGIWVLITQGLSNKEIARNLGLTAETVKSHLKNIYPKLGVQNRAQAAAKRLGQTR